MFKTAIGCFIFSMGFCLLVGTADASPQEKLNVSIYACNSQHGKPLQNKKLNAVLSIDQKVIFEDNKNHTVEVIFNESKNDKSKFLVTTTFNNLQSTPKHFSTEGSSLTIMNSVDQQKVELNIKENENVSQYFDGLCLDAQKFNSLY